MFMNSAELQRDGTYLTVSVQPIDSKKEIEVSV